MQTNPKASAELVPLLIVRGAARAIEFYVEALGATLLACYRHGAEQRVSHADLVLGAARFAVTEEARAWNSDAAPTLGGSPVVLQLNVGDAGAVLASMTGAGATVVFPLQELFGERMARVRDPFGQLWLLRQRLFELSVEEIQRQRDELFEKLTKEASTLSDAGAAPQRPRIHLVVGPVGAGKSSFGLGLARDRSAVRLTLDEWMTELFRADRPDAGVMEWYVERSARCIEQIWKVTRGLLAAGTDAVLEIGLLTRAERERFYRRVDEAGLDLTLHVLDAPRDVRRRRVEQRNLEQGATFSMIVPPAIFELASDLWESPDPDECSGRDVRFIR